ncbi:MAG: N-acetylmuramoyl-L-alanine amidase [Oscillospiraceae bacterium]|jgi:N-acetylmuramoyl-L-alanine amidase|nr:N-acetylmuramoyl-L-alanine amidase [Oscillospiraceae bacterium]
MLRRNLFILLLLLLLVSVIGYLLCGPEPALPAAGGSGEENGAFTPYAYTPVIDPGHGGPDGGTESVSGIQESRINLEIGLKTDLIMRFLGLHTAMTRDTDVSIHDVEAVSLRDMKTSDLRNRVRLINGTENGVLLSIHQNYFDQSQYYGAQVFYSGAKNKTFADVMQETLRLALDPANDRKSKPTNSVYLLNNVTRPAVLIECGFLSNPGEEALLRSEKYQRKVAMAVCQGFLSYTKEIKT